LQTTPETQTILPSQTLGASESVSQAQLEADQQTRGIAIHRMLELLCSGENPEQARKRVANECALISDSVEITSWLKEAHGNYTEPKFQQFFDQQLYHTAYNEVPVQYQAAGKTVYGIIDRVIVQPDEVWVLDYKTHVAAQDAAAISSLMEFYRPQLGYYATAARHLWPEKKIRAALLFTHSRSLVMLD